ncbi:MAG: serine/threonine protein kinase, partial [Planctomycetota bacterium]|nr:serine/threonine protein kinase [Planctomycetota bacterium]
MSHQREDVIVADYVMRNEIATREQVDECLALLDRLRGEMNLETSLADVLLQKGFCNKAQRTALEQLLDPAGAARRKNVIPGYQLLERVGVGAMGSVYKARDLDLDIPVAVKVLRLALSNSPTQIERLKREARLVARLSHENIVASRALGHANGLHYLVMEFVDGKTVRSLLRKEPLAEADALAIARDVAHALAHAHDAGIIHRDVKPGNVMRTKDGRVKLADFGLARGQAPSDLTLEHASIGTPHYVAPEQMRRAADANERSDLFGLGATLYHMVTGRPPFQGETLGEIIQ